MCCWAAWQSAAAREALELSKSSRESWAAAPTSRRVIGNYRRKNQGPDDSGTICLIWESGWRPCQAARVAAASSHEIGGDRAGQLVLAQLERMEIGAPAQ